MVSKIPKDAVQILSTHRALLQELESARDWCAQLPSLAADCAKAMLDHQAESLLSQMPIQELSRYQRGIRIKTLRDCHYETMWDLYQADCQTLADIDGISNEGASEIKRLTAGIAAQVRSHQKLRLSLDDRSPQASKLVLALYLYRTSLEPGKTCRELLSRFGNGNLAAMEDLDPMLSTIRRIFSGKGKKERAFSAYSYLRETLTGEYGQRARAVIGYLKNLERSGPDAAWEDFRNNSIAYYNILEVLRPGDIGSQDSRYGLPQDLAHQIQAQPLHLEGLKCQLRRYQQWGVKYILCQKRVLLGDEMGLGKTVQAIAAMVSLYNQGQTHFLVICPASVLENWCREIKKHSSLSVVKLHGDKRDLALSSWKKDGGVAVTTYETTASISLDQPYSMAILDEAHYIKNPEAQRTQNCRRLCEFSERILFMTGTALENRVDEMIFLISLLQPRIAQSVSDMLSLSSAPEFREMIAPVYYRRRREDVLTELPELIENQEWCQMEPIEEQIYETAVLENRFSDCRRVSWNTPDLKHSTKGRRLLELCDEAAEDGRKIIVFSFFLDTISKVQTLLGNRCLTPINGSVSPVQRQQIIDDFEAAPSGTVLPAQIQAGGTGLNIQCASVVILCEPQLKPSLENQAISRAYRMGQTRNVLVYRLLCEDSVDERITELLQEKQSQFDAFADSSAAAEQSLELDHAVQNDILAREAQRIRKKLE